MYKFKSVIMGHKRQVRRFTIVLFAIALAFFICALIFKLTILTILGYAPFIGAIYLQYFYLPGLKKKKIVLEEVQPSEVLDLGDKIKLYWDKFIVWLHT